MNVLEANMIVLFFHKILHFDACPPYSVTKTNETHLHACFPRHQDYGTPSRLDFCANSWSRKVHFELEQVKSCEKLALSRQRQDIKNEGVQSSTLQYVDEIVQEEQLTGSNGMKYIMAIDGQLLH